MPSRNAVGHSEAAGEDLARKLKVARLPSYHPDSCLEVAAYW